MYAHATIEDPRDGKIIRPGDKVPEDLPGLNELKDSGAVSSAEYEAPKRELPPVVDIDGTLYVNSELSPKDAKNALDEAQANQNASSEVRSVRAGDKGNSNQGSK